MSECCCEKCSKPKECCCNGGNFPSHKDELNRLNRIAGQIAGIQKMIDDGRYCLDIIMQINAVRAALKSVENNILERHLNSCVMNALQQTQEERCQKVKEILDLFKKIG